MMGKWRSGDKQADSNEETDGHQETNSNKETEYKDSENRYRCGYNQGYGNFCSNKATEAAVYGVAELV